MTDDELKPCPFCGSEKLDIIESGAGWKSGVECRGCKMNIYFFDKKGVNVAHKANGDVGEIIARWNRRYVCPDRNGQPVYEGDKVTALCGNTCLVKLVPALVPLSDAGKDVGFDPRTCFGEIELVQEASHD